MDKVWWNEQWMDYPVGPHYAEQSNTVNAHRLQGALLLTVGELDTNVDPASTYQVVNALIKATRILSFSCSPAAAMASAKASMRRKRMDFCTPPARCGTACEVRAAFPCYSFPYPGILVSLPVQQKYSNPRWRLYTRMHGRVWFWLRPWLSMQRRLWIFREILPSFLINVCLGPDTKKKPCEARFVCRRHCDLGGYAAINPKQPARAVCAAA